VNYKDPNLSVEKRVDDLLSRMTIPEKVSQLCCIWPLSLVGKEVPDDDLMHKYMQNGLGRMTQFANMLYHSHPNGVAEFTNKIQEFNIKNTRLGIPVLFQNEAINGFICVKATSFPATMNMAATWDPELMEKVGKTIKNEMYAVGVRQALAPQLDITQEPRWGRVAETFGEDPYLTSNMGVSFVNGIQGEDLNNGVLATGKHFVGYGITQGGLNLAAIRIGEIELREVFAKPFEAAIKMANMQSVMAAYPEINGVPANCNREILQDLLRGELGFQGHVVSEGSGVETLVTRFHVAKDMREAAILALKAGIDADTPITQSYDKLVDLINDGEVEESLLDESVTRVLTAKFNLGLFENPFAHEITLINEVFDNKESDEINKRVTEESIILIKNEDQLLPIGEKIKSIALIGPFANNLRVMFPNYSFPASVEMLMKIVQGGSEENKNSDDILGNLPENATAKIFGDLLEKSNIEDIIRENYPYTKTILEGIQEILPAKLDIQYAKGCDIEEKSTDKFDEAIQIAKQSDLVIIALGGKSGWVDSTCGEGKDSTSLDLPGVQQNLLEEIHKSGKPVALIVFNGRPYSINWAINNIPSILFVGNPGPWGGEVIAKTLFGLINPGGKTTMTVPRSVGQVPIFYNHKIGSGYEDVETGDMVSDLFLGGYRNEPRTPLIPFGSGISYTQFSYSNLTINPKQVESSKEVVVSCSIENSGKRFGDEVVQLYIRDCEARVTRPVKELMGFKRVSLAPGEKCEVGFILKMSQLGFINEERKFVVEPGKMDVMIGSSSKEIHLRDSFEITGKPIELAHDKTFLSDVKCSKKEQK